MWRLPVSGGTEAGALRPRVGADEVSVMLEYPHSVRIGDDERMNRLQHRYLTPMLDALHLTDESAAGAL